MSEALLTRRIDQWLFFSRLTKSRSLAGRYVVAGKVRVNKQKINKPAQLIYVGDVITAMINKKLVVVEVLALGTRRGPATEAQELYLDMTPRKDSKKVETNTKLMLAAPSRPKGEGRPTKKQRRQLDLLKQRAE